MRTLLGWHSHLVESTPVKRNKNRYCPQTIYEHGMNIVVCLFSHTTYENKLKSQVLIENRWTHNERFVIGSTCKTTWYSIMFIENTWTHTGHQYFPQKTHEHTTTHRSFSQKPYEDTMNDMFTKRRKMTLLNHNMSNTRRKLAIPIGIFVESMQ